MPEKPRVLFVCTHNSARSQMAEGWLRHLAPERYEAASAGTEPRGVHPLAIRVMEEAGVDLSGHRSEHVDEHVDPPADYVVTVCDSAKEACPYVPARKRTIHHSFEDPSAAEGTEAERRAVFRRVRDEIQDWVREAFIDHPVSATDPNT